MSTKDLHLAELAKTVYQKEQVDNFQALAEPHEVARNSDHFRNIRSLPDLMQRLENTKSELYDNIYVNDKRLATLTSENSDKPMRYELDENNANFFSHEYGLELKVAAFRLEKTNIVSGEYALFLKIGNQQEREVLDKDNQQFVATNENQILRKMQLMVAGVDDYNNCFKYDSGVLGKVVTLQVKDDQYPLFVMQGENTIDNEHAIDEFNRSFSNKPAYTIINHIPYYEAPKAIFKNQEAVEKAINNLVDVTDDDEVENVMNFLKSKQSEKQKKKTNYSPK